MAGAAAVVVLGGSIAPFLTPAVLRFEQDRTGVTALTGLDRPGLDYVMGQLLGDLVLWRGDFAVQMLNPGPEDLLSQPERAHMRDVRRVFTGFWALVLAAAVVVAVGFARARGTEARVAAWRAVRNGARVLAVAIVVAGAIALVAFEPAFEVFHRLLFSVGSYTFDPARNKLVQLFPEQFWSEISIAVGAVILVVASVTAWVAGRRMRLAQRRAEAA